MTRLGETWMAPDGFRQSQGSPASSQKLWEALRISVSELHQELRAARQQSARATWVTANGATVLPRRHVQ
eukprot:13095619-Alexandrium_andersonii.AAC.1